MNNILELDFSILMKYYFKLQYLRFSRRLKNLGVNPIIAIILGLLAFAVISKVLFAKTQFAHWIYLLLAITSIAKLTNSTRVATLQKVFSKRHFHKIRLIENSLVGAPFILYLIFEKEFFIGLILFTLIVVLAFANKKLHWIKAVPTPFRKIPFEFIVGFRKTLWLIAIAYFIVAKAIQVGNYNLGLFGLSLIFFTSMSFYQKPEEKYFIWIYTDNVRSFLTKKILTAFLGISILTCIAVMALFIGFTSSWLTTILVYIVGHIFLCSMILAKYSAYPNKMNIPQGIFYALSLLFPPMLIITIFVFYFKSQKSLKPILEW